MTCEQCKERFVAAYYSELSDEEHAGFEEHISSCTECSRAYQQITKTLKLMNRRVRVEPGEEYWANYWQNVNAKIEAEKQTTPKSILPFHHQAVRGAFVPAWAYGIAAVLLVAIGIYLGKMLFVSRNEEPIRQFHENVASGNTQTAIATKDTVDEQVRNYFDRSKVLLLGVLNSPGGTSSPSTVVHQQQISRELITQASYLQTALKEPDQEHLRQLVEDLKVVLMQLANYSKQNGVPLIELVKQGADKKSILLKINVEEIRALGSQAKTQVNVTPDTLKSKI